MTLTMRGPNDKTGYGIIMDATKPSSCITISCYWRTQDNGPRIFVKID
jgi:hypothetical protein